MTSGHSADRLDDGCSEEAAARSDPRWERYLEYCAALKQRGLACQSFADWIVQSEEGY